MKHALKRAFPATLPVLAGYLFLGIAYGVTMRESGFGFGWTALASMTVYAGSMQFALIGLMAAAFSPVTTVLMTLLVNARHLFYGLSLLEPYGRASHGRQYLIFALTDETYSLVISGAPQDVDAERWYLAVTALDHSYWVLGSCVGALLGQVIPFDMSGVEFAMTALFTVIVTEQTIDMVKAVRDGKMRLGEGLFPLLLGLAATILSLLLVGKSGFLIAAMAAMLACFFLRFSITEGRCGA
ncbi:MAG: AzlC family ABC transporter permease [Clostridia bacterium]|nr:AzlC family ABC transporter permease [Clostridia bacterium]